MKKAIIIPTVFLGILGGYALAQTEIFSSAENVTKITAAQAKELALKEFNGKIIEFEYDHDDLVPHYDFEIVGTTEKVDVEVDAMTGTATITERETIKKASPSQAPKITATQAKELALKKFNGKIIEFEYDDDDAVPHYDFEIASTTEKVDVEVDAMTGTAAITNRKTIKKGNSSQATQAPNNQTTQSQQIAQTTPNKTTTAPQASNTITKAQAIAIAQQRVAGTVTKVEFDDDDFEYEIEIKNGQIEYKFKIHAKTGAILSYEEDHDDDDDLDD
ncbi:PepSY domain-containing protein [Lysinibacillus sp. KU-BSD001]|uniref:PepSY domain-containing protein n=1 Tax=Lysinibacillus sp. KU-BSD001 TaxID=3141328 RepID=UPI0036EE8973